MSQPKPCVSCGLKPVIRKRLRHCFDCQPGGPRTPPPCRRCGSADYYSAGLCSSCHQYAPQPPGSCLDCHAWGVSRHGGWLCGPCIGWRGQYPAVAPCRSCSRPRHVGRGAVCRLCWRQASEAREATKRQRPYRPIDVIGANREGQQLFFAFLSRRQRVRRPNAIGSSAPRRYPPRPRQLSLFDTPADSWAKRRGLPEPPRTGRTDVLEALVRDHAKRHGWSWNTAKRARLGIRVLVGRKRSPDELFRASEVLELTHIGLHAVPVLAVLGEAGLLDDDRLPAVVAWFERQIVDLPTPMADELRVWFDVQRLGSTAPPRSRPRATTTIRLRVTFALPALRAWAAAGHSSLREISRSDVLEVLPPSGNQRALTGGALRSVFGTLKARKLVFTNPTTRIDIGATARRTPLPADLDDLRAALQSPRPAQAALAALLAFHAVRPGQLRTLKLTDVRDGRLHLEHGTVVLAEPVRRRLTAWLDYRNRRWPNTANPYLFVHARTATGTGPIGHTWVGRTLGVAPSVLRVDRILNEVNATGGDVRRLCDLFGLSVHAASHYVGSFQRPGGAGVAPPDGIS